MCNGPVAQQGDAGGVQGTEQGRGARHNRQAPRKGRDQPQVPSLSGNTTYLQRRRPVGGLLLKVCSGNSAVILKIFQIGWQILIDWIKLLTNIFFLTTYFHISDNADMMQIDCAT